MSVQPLPDWKYQIYIHIYVYIHTDVIYDNTHIICGKIKKHFSFELEFFIELTYEHYVDSFTFFFLFRFLLLFPVGIHDMVYMILWTILYLSLYVWAPFHYENLIGKNYSLRLIRPVRSLIQHIEGTQYVQLQSDQNSLTDTHTHQRRRNQFIYFAWVFSREPQSNFNFYRLFSKLF